jgi:hypothetical protein
VVRRGAFKRVLERASAAGSKGRRIKSARRGNAVNQMRPSFGPLSRAAFVLLPAVVAIGRETAAPVSTRFSMLFVYGRTRGSNAVDTSI